MRVAAGALMLARWKQRSPGELGYGIACSANSVKSVAYRCLSLLNRLIMMLPNRRPGACIFGKCYSKWAGLAHQHKHLPSDMSTGINLIEQTAFHLDSSVTIL
jgi:hypothetical protein